MQNNYFKIKAVILLLFISFNIYGQLPQCERAVNFAELDINNVRAKFRASGDMWFDSESSPFNTYQVPQNSNANTFFSFDLWMAARDEFEQKRMSYQLYGGELSGIAYFPGPLEEEGFTTPFQCERYDRVWKINKSTLDSFRMGLLLEIPKDILEWPAKGNPNFLPAINQDLAPFVDINNDQIYNALDGDYPEVLGDQALWWVFNEMGGYLSLPGYLPLQCEVQVMAYAYNSIPELQNHTFYKYTFTNKAAGRLDSVMIGMYMDADLGQFDDDYVGCDTLRNMGIMYNGDALDGSFGADIPMLGVKLLRGPQKEDGIFSNMYSFFFKPFGFTVWNFPDTLDGIYNLFWGLHGNGMSMTYGEFGQGNGDGKPTRYMFPSDPTDSNGWSECTVESNYPSDRKMFMSVGPFSLERFEQKELHFAALFVRDSIEYPCPSFAPIQEAADYVQALFDTGLITNIEEEPTASNKNIEIRLFPNPLKENRILTLQFQQQNFNSRLQKGTFQLYDNLGRLVESVTLRGERETQLQLSELQSGIYFYRLRWENGGVENGKLVVE